MMTSDADSNYCFLNMISAMTPLPFGKSQNKQLSSQAGLSTSSAIFKPCLASSNEKLLLFKKCCYENERYPTDW